MERKILIFGEEYNQDWLNAQSAREILEEAYKKINISSETNIDTILFVLEKVSKAWLDPQYHLRQKALEYLISNTSFSEVMIEKSFEYIGLFCSKNYNIERINTELGSIEYLSSFCKHSTNLQSNPLLQESSLQADEIGVEIHKNKLSNIQNNKSFFLSTRPKGVILNINQGNQYFEIIENLIPAILTKNINIIKISDENYYLMHLFLESIREFDEQNIVFPNQTLLFWKNNNDIEEIIYNGVDSICFNGDFENLNILKSKIKYNIKIIENVYSFSFAVIEGKYIKQIINSDSLYNLAKDICIWNQKTSFSPHVIYVIDKDLKSTHLLIESLFDKMIQINDDIPNGNLTFDEKVDIRRIREKAKISQVLGEGRLVCPDDFSFTLILEYNPRFKISCMNRTLFVKRVLNLDGLFEQLLPFSGKLNTSGIYVSDELKKYIERDFINLGIKRITNIGEMCKKHIGQPINGYFLLRELVDWVTLV